MMLRDFVMVMFGVLEPLDVLIRWHVLSQRRLTPRSQRRARCLEACGAKFVQRKLCGIHV